jgi:hypothetical protein
MSEKNFICCEECGKRLIERLPNGLYRFVFGRNPNDPGNPPVDITVHGNIKIKCLRRSCGHINILNYFPFEEDQKRQVG